MKHYSAISAFFKLKMLNIFKIVSYRLTTLNFLFVTCTPESGFTTPKKTHRHNNRNKKLKASSDNSDLKQHKQDQTGKSYCAKTARSGRYRM